MFFLKVSFKLLILNLFWIILAKNLQFGFFFYLKKLKMAIHFWQSKFSSNCKSSTLAMELTCILPDWLLGNLFSIILDAWTNTSCAHNGRKQATSIILLKIFICESVSFDGEKNRIFWDMRDFGFKDWD